MARIEREAKAAAQVTLAQPDPLSVAQARLAPDEALVLFELTSAEGVALIVRKNSSRIATLPASSDIKGAAQKLLSGKRGVDPSASDALATLVVKPLKLPSDVRHVLVSPTGILGFVPFAMLMPNRAVSFSPSATTHGLLLQDRALQGTSVLAVGDPNYGSVADSEDDPILGTLTGKKVIAARAGRGLFKLSRLPNTRDEATAIGSIQLFDNDATETRVRQELRKHERWRSIHFACHGLVHPERPDYSALALAPDDDSDGLLTALEVFQMRVPTDLVVMSACQTGKGKIFKTEGIVGLTRAFMFAGAPRVLCSLWDVDDAATKALMVKFYELWNPKSGKGIHAADALKQAQEFVRGHKKWAHPAYWAAWVLWGLGR